MWEYTWTSISTAKKKKFKVNVRIEYVEQYLTELISRLTHTRPIHINYTYSGGANYKYTFIHKVKSDWINVPCWKRFKDRKYYYKALLHELSHCMMERQGISQKLDSENDEEIVSELSSMIICLLLGINTWDESCRYIGDYMINNNGLIIHEGRREYIKKYTYDLLRYVLRLK